jgi:topoisomerase-4 subunit B
MSPEQLWETTMNPDTRRLMRVGLGDVANAETAATMTMLMGRAESQARRAWLEEHGNEIEADV